MKLLRFFIVIIISAMTSVAFGQTSQDFTIKGKVVDSLTNEPLPYATVTLRVDNNPLKTVSTDEKGLFTITQKQPWDYNIIITFVGYTKLEKPVKLSTEKIVDMGVLTMKSSTDIKEVNVVGQLITADVDKVTYNTSLDPEATALTALEMMRKVPMLSVDGDDNLELRGQRNFKILVNGKTSATMGSNYKEVLRAMPASSIKRIEVITNPPAKYDAEGVGGIINIVTIRKTFDSYFGQLMIMGETRGMLAGGGYLGASLGKFSLSTYLFYGGGTMKGMRSNTHTDNFNFPDSRYQNSTISSDVDYGVYNTSIDMGYEIDSLNLLSLSISGHWGDQGNTANGITEFLNSLSQISSKYSQSTLSNTQFGSISGNIDYQRSFQKPGRMLTLSYQLERTPNNSNFENKYKGIQNFADYTLRSENEAWGMEHTAQVDYVEPTSKVGQLELGAKYILRPNVSDNFTYINDEYDPNRKNGLDYMQHIGAVYTSYQHKIKKISLKGGFRAEYTLNTGSFRLKEDHSLFNRYFDVIPYAAISYGMKQGQTLRLGYNNRLSRPTIGYLNPYINEQDPQNVRQGNPELKSEVSHVFDLSYGKYSQKGNVNISASTHLGNNAVQSYTYVGEDGRRYTKYDNIGKSQIYGLNFNGSMNLSQGKMRLNINSTINYSMLEKVGEDARKNQGWGGNISGGMYAQTWKDANVNAYGGVYFSKVELQSNTTPGYFYMVGISQKMLKKKVTLSLNAMNPFHYRMKTNADSWGTGFASRTEAEYRAQSFRLSLAWNFGNTITQVKKAKRSIKNEDKLKTEQNQNPGSGSGVGM